MNRDNNTTRRQQPVATSSTAVAAASSIKRPINARPSATMTTTTTTTNSQAASNSNTNGGQRPVVVGASKTLGANMATRKTQRPANVQSALMKKAYVRFDDYLDLNEENMRRSCKRLMNHLYSDSNSPSTASAASSGAATTTTRQSSSSPASVEDLKSTGAPIKPSMANNLNGGINSCVKSKSTNISINCKTATASPTNASVSQQQKQILTNTTTTQAAAITNGKSYLRSQYERRQQRQLELMSKMQLEPATGKQGNNNADGANQSRQKQQQQQQHQQKQTQHQNEHWQQQQDLVAKSHELSKRRFFEKLERRESIRNLNLNTPTATTPPTTVAASKRPVSNDAKSSCSLTKVGSSPEIVVEQNYKQQQLPPPSSSSEPTDRQKSLGDDELMLKVYQSIILKGNSSSNLSEKENFGDDTLGELDGTQAMTDITNGTKELDNELIGFHSPALQSAADSELRQQQEQQQQHLGKLFDFSTQKQEEKCFSNGMSTNNTSSCLKLKAQITEVSNSSAEFEIKVPEKGNNFNQNPLDGFISSGLLTVKQVELAQVESHLLPPSKQRTSASDGGLVEMPHTLSGHLKEDASTQLVANKTLPKNQPTDADDLTDNKVEQIDGQHYGSKTMQSKSIIVGGVCGAKSVSSSNTSAAIGSDNQQEQELGISSTISSENNHNNITSNAMNKAIQPFGDLKSTTTDNESGSKSEESTSSSLKKSPTKQQLLLLHQQMRQQQMATVTSGGGGSSSESNCAKDHEAPEMRMLVGQSGGANKNSKNGDLVAPEVVVVESNLSYPLQIESAAQVQQVASLQTTITINQEIRDVQPEANEINRIESVVSCCNSEANNADKVTVIPSKQVNEVYGIAQQHGKSFDSSNGYANSVLDEAGRRENNVNHDVSEVKLKNFACSNQHLGEQSEHLIESSLLTTKQSMKHHPNLTQKDSNSPSVEEDGGSSCSSSGFGASVSVTSSSEGSNSFTDAMMVVASGCESGATRPRPNSLAILPLSRDEDPIYDCVRPRLNWSRNQQPKMQNIVSTSAHYNSNEFPDYKQLVGPDQAYPSKGRLLLVENHNYASILNKSCVQQANEGDANFVLEQDDFDLDEGYANLPLCLDKIKNKNDKAPPNVCEYATVRPNISNMEEGSENKKKVNNSASNGSLSGHSYSTSSTANSGGFSALPPATTRLQESCPSSNNFHSTADLSFENGADSPKKISIFKRFGSLVSRTFTGSSPMVQPQSPPAMAKSVSKINESPENCSSEKQKVGCELSDINGTAVEQRSALVIEQNHHLHQQQQQEILKEKQQIDEADLVILPPKHVNQRKPLIDEQYPTMGAHMQRGHDDRLSRGKRHSRKLKKTDSASLTSISSAIETSSTSSSSSSSSTNVRTQRRREHPKRSESLFEDLESLVSASEQQSNHYGRLVSHSRPQRAVSSTNRRYQHKVESRVDIDCVSPLEKRADERTNERQHKSSGPRSLLRIFSAISSQKSSGSTPNLATTPTPPTSCDFNTNNCDQVASGQETGDQSLQPISGFWGFSSLVMGGSHANASETTATDKNLTNRKLRTKTSAKTNGDERQTDYQANSLVYSNLQPLTKGYHLQLSSCTQQQEQQHSLEKYQSLNLYQNLLRNYAKRRNRNRHGHHHHHHHHTGHNHYGSSNGHHHHHYHHHRSHRHSHRSLSSSTRCATNCGQQNCCSSTCSESSGTTQSKSVWGQLIKINKSDGSQVIELQRLPGKSWGFFVARGAINNVKGIFISRMHDSVTSNSLTGLLSIGDRILAIDECPIEPDYDILRVNQMISKKSKILLKVKPFKG